jgi:hypothetical protein
MTNAMTAKPDTQIASRQEMTWAELKAQCAELIKTGFLPAHLKTPEQAAAVVLKGRELGIGMMQAFEGIYVISGKTAMVGQLMLAQAYRTGLVESLAVVFDADNTCQVSVTRKGDASPYKTRFGKVEALAMGLSGKDNYRKQFRTMAKWRALSDALRTKFPDALGGVYTPEELGAQVRVSGDSIEVIAEQLPPPPPPPDQPAETSRPVATDRVISDKELKYFMAKLNEFGIGEEDQKAYVVGSFNKTSRKNLTVLEMTQMIEHFNKLTMPQDPEARETV